MVNINLHQAAEQDLKINRKKSIFKSAMFLSFSLLAVVLLVFGIVIAYQKYLLREKEVLAKEKVTSLNSLNAKEVGDLIQFKNKTDQIIFNLDNKKNPKDILSLVEGMMVKGASLNSLDYDDTDGSLELKMVAGSFRLAANQMLNLKKSGLFSDVSITDSGRDEAGQAMFTLKAVFKSDDKDNESTDKVSK